MVARSAVIASRTASITRARSSSRATSLRTQSPTARRRLVLSAEALVTVAYLIASALMRGLWRASLVSAVLFLSSGPALAATYDPALKWHSAETAHWIVYWYDGEELVADRYLKLVEPIYDRVSKAVDSRPEQARTFLALPAGKTRLVITDITDSANGFALTIPYNEITLFVTAPTEGSSLDNYDDWLTMLLTHEFTHICHLTKVRGVPLAMRYLFGAVAAPNQVAPRWTIEGYATYQETQLTTGGRGRSAFSDMIVRAAVLEGKFPPIDRAVGDTEKWPVGYLPYVFGVEFLEYLRETYGDDKLTLFTKLTGSEEFPFFPFWPRFSRHARQAFGKSFKHLWSDWHASLVKRYGDQKEALEAAGLTKAEKLTHWGGSTNAPRVSPDGKSIVYSMADGKHYPSIRLMNIDGKKDKSLIESYAADSFGWSADSKVVAFSSQKLWQEFYLWNDIYTWSLDDSVLTRKTRGARARTPDFKPDGTELTFVADDVSNSDLVTLKVDESLKWETNQTDFTQWSEPRWKPDGKELAVSLWSPGGFRDIALVDPKGKVTKRITADRFLDRDPSWSPDGKYLFFSSDRSGIPNIYAWEAA